jgi:hypothetical protein
MIHTRGPGEVTAAIIAAKSAAIVADVTPVVAISVLPFVTDAGLTPADTARVGSRN